MTPSRLAAVGVVLLGLLALASPGAADTGSAAIQGTSFGKQTDAFSRLLFELGFQPLPTFAALHDKPSEALLIVLGDPSCLSRDNFPQGLRAFVEQGGAVLIATDKKTEGEAGKELHQLAGVTVTGELLECSNADKYYERSPYCPFVQPNKGPPLPKASKKILTKPSALVEIANWPALFRNRRTGNADLRIATNAPSYLVELHSTRGIRHLASLPANCAPSAHHDGFSHSSLSDKLIFAVGGTVGKGRVLVLADHSIFINRMMLPRDNDNLAFAANCLHWLRSGVLTPEEALRAFKDPNVLSHLMGQRKKVLFWEDGSIRTDLEVPLKPPALRLSLPPEPVIVAAIDKTIAHLENRDFFNRQILAGMDNLPGGRQGVLRTTVVLLTLAALVLLAYRFVWKMRHRPELGVPSLAKALRQHEPQLPRLRQKSKIRNPKSERESNL